MTDQEKAGLTMALIAFKTINDMIQQGFGVEDIGAVVNRNIEELERMIADQRTTSLDS